MRALFRGRAQSASDEVGGWRARVGGWRSGVGMGVPLRSTGLHSRRAKRRYRARRGASRTQTLIGPRVRCDRSRSDGTERGATGAGELTHGCFLRGRSLGLGVPPQPLKRGSPALTDGRSSFRLPLRRVASPPPSQNLVSVHRATRPRGSRHGRPPCMAAYVNGVSSRLLRSAFIPPTCGVALRPLTHTRTLAPSPCPSHKHGLLA